MDNAERYPFTGADPALGEVGLQPYEIDSVGVPPALPERRIAKTRQSKQLCNKTSSRAFPILRNGAAVFPKSGKRLARS